MRKQITKNLLSLMIMLSILVVPMSVFAIDKNSSTITLPSGQTKFGTNELNTLITYAASDSDVAQMLIQESYSGVPSDMSKYVTYTDSDGLTYYVPKSSAHSLVNSYNSKINALKADDQAINSLSEATEDLNVKADVLGAGDALKGFVGPISILLGVLVGIASLGMTVYSAFDIIYIAFPAFRGKHEQAKEEGAKWAEKLVSDDAQHAVVKANTVETGKNPFAIYFGKRVVSYILLTIMVFILLTGRITIITDIALGLVSGVLDILQGI